MGQYHCVVSLDRREKLHPHSFGDGLKMLEFGCSSGGTLLGLTVLLAGSVKGGPRGGGDLRAAGPWKDILPGRWCGDRIAIVGDYDADGDVRGCTKAQLDATEFADISGPVIELLKASGEWDEERKSWGTVARVHYNAESDTFIEDLPEDAPTPTEQVT